VLFIRRRERRSADGIHVYWASSTEHATSLSAAVVEDYRELLELTFDAPGHDPAHPLLLVCTHGKHDACCAKYGVPLYEAIREVVDDSWVWQSSHVGGDRFAGNLVCLPDGLYYGRVSPGDAWTVIDEHLGGRIQLDFYRGRSCYPFHVQAAERAVREAAAAYGVGELELRSRSPIVFRAGGVDYEVEVVREHGELAHLTCDAAGLSRPPRYAARILRESAA
jgi:hypothetical protein